MFWCWRPRRSPDARSDCAFRPSWWPAWLQYVAAAQVGTEPVTIQTLFIQLFGQIGGWLAPPVILAMVFAALQFDPRSDGWLPVWFALSSAGVIYRPAAI